MTAPYFNPVRDALTARCVAKMGAEDTMRYGADFLSEALAFYAPLVDAAKAVKTALVDDETATVVDERDAVKALVAALETLEGTR